MTWKWTRNNNLCLRSGNRTLAVVAQNDQGRWTYLTGRHHPRVEGPVKCETAEEAASRAMDALGWSK